MKKTLRISLVALFAAVPMMAMAETGDPTSATSQPANRAAAVTAGLAVSDNPYFKTEAINSTTDKNAASAGYVKGAYNAAIKAVNTVHAEAVDAAAAAAAAQSTADSALTKANNALTSSSELDGAKLKAKSVATGAIADSAVTDAKINAGAVTSAKLATSAVETAKINAKAVTAEKIADNTITAAQIATSGVGSDEIAAGAVTNAKIADSAVTFGKLDSTAVSTSISSTSTNTQLATASAVYTATSAAETAAKNFAKDGGNLTAGTVTKDKLETSVQSALNKAGTAVQSVATGSANGHISVDGTDVKVKGINDAAYKAVASSITSTSTDLATASQVYAAESAAKTFASAAIERATASKTGASLAVNIASQSISGSGLTVSVPTGASYDIMQTWGSDSATSATYSLAGSSSVNVGGSATLNAISTSATGDITGIDVKYVAQ